MTKATHLDDAILPERVRAVLQLVMAHSMRHLQALVAGGLDEAATKIELTGMATQDKDVREAAFAYASSVPRKLPELQRWLHDQVETRLAGMRAPEPMNPAELPDSMEAMRLVDYEEVEAHALFDTLARELEVAQALPIALLGQRFAVLAAKPPFTPQALPLGPQDFCALLRQCIEYSGCPPRFRLAAAECFRERGQTGYRELVADIDRAMAEEGILPGLNRVAYRRPVDANEPGDATPRRRAHTGWPSERPAGESDPRKLQALERLLAEHGGDKPSAETPAHSPAAADGPPSAEDIDQHLQRLQAEDQDTPPPGQLHDLAQATRTLTAPREQQALVPELLDLMFRHLHQGMRADPASNHLLRRLQIPLLRAALRDPLLIAQDHHPVRRLLELVTEHGAHWVGDGDLDPRLQTMLRQTVDEVSANYQGNDAVFAEAVKRLQTELDKQRRKAELMERRHVEAMLGKERLGLAKRRANDVLEDAIMQAGVPVPRFRRQLLQAWADVLVLTLLQQGEESAEWQHLLQLTEALVQQDGHAASAHPDMCGEVSAALARVGHHPTQARALAEHLTSQAEPSDEGLSRTELLLHLKTHDRLGADAAQADSTPVLDLREREHLQTLRELPFGSWLEIDDGKGGRVRRRLSWYSQSTDHMLLVNQRGQRTGEGDGSLGAMARMLATGQAVIIMPDGARLVDQALEQTLDKLRASPSRWEHARAAKEPGR